MYTCPENDIHSIYLDGELPTAYISEYEEHLKSCPSCAKKAEKLRALKDELKKDCESLNFTKEKLDESFLRLQTKLSYSKTTQKSKNSFLYRGKFSYRFPKFNNSIKYFAAGIAAACLVMLITPGRFSRTKGNGDTQQFQPVMLSSTLPSLDNQVKTDGNIDAFALNSILASDSQGQAFHPVRVSSDSETTILLPVRVNTHFSKAEQKPSLTSYDIFTPREEGTEVPKNRGSFVFYVSYPMSNSLIEMGEAKPEGN